MQIRSQTSTDVQEHEESEEQTKVIRRRLPQVTSFQPSRPHVCASVRHVYCPSGTVTGRPIEGSDTWDVFKGSLFKEVTKYIWQQSQVSPGLSTAQPSFLY